MTASLAELAAQITAAPDDLAGYAVLGDALTAAGDPRGELIALELAAAAAAVPDGRGSRNVIDKKRRAAADKHFAAHAKAFLGPLAPHAAALTWRAGFIRRAVITASPNSDPAKLLAQLLAHPSGQFVAELVLRVETAHQADYVIAALLAAYAAAPPALRELELVAPGKPTGDDRRELAPPLGEVRLDRLLPAVPRLEQLGVTARLVRLAPPQLLAARRIKLACGTLSAQNMQALVAAPWPALERLDLRFGTREDAAAPATFADVRPLLAQPDRLPALTHLRLRNAPFAGGLLRELQQAPLTRQLAVVELSHGSMSPADAAALIANPAPLAHLKELWLPMRLLRATDRAKLAALGPHIVDDTRAPRDNTDQLLYDS